MAELTLSALGRMKVTDLRKECEKFGLDTVGLKATLISRLKDYHVHKGEEGFEQSLTDITINEGESTLGDGGAQSGCEEVQDLPEKEESVATEITEPVQKSENNDDVAGRELVINEEDYEELDYFEEPENAENLEDRECLTLLKEKDEPCSAAEKLDASDKRDDVTGQHSGGEESEDQVGDKKELVKEEFEGLNLTFNSECIQLDPYTSDLHFLISKEDCLSGCNMTLNELSHFWCSAKASYGVGPGKKVYYECKFVRSMDIKLPEIEAPDNALRVGFSNSAINHLGDHASSVGIENNGRVLSNSIIVGSSPRFVVGDSVLVCADTTQVPYAISFYVNGTKVEAERHLTIEENDSMVIFPHVYFKNVEFTLDFTSEHTHESLSGYIPMGSVGREFLFPSFKQKPDFSSCALYMLCGPIACGKTHWASSFKSSVSEPMTVLGRSYFYDRWRVLGQRKKIRLSERVVKKALEKVLSIASQSCRTFILDQTNCYLTTRKKRLEHFVNFPKKFAVVVLPSVSEYDKRIKKVRSEEFDPSNDQRKINEMDIMELKKKFEIPTLAEGFDEIIYVDTNKDFAQITLEDYKYDNRLHELIKRESRRISSLCGEVKILQKRLRLLTEENLRRKRRRSTSFDRLKQYPPARPRLVFREEPPRRPISPRRSRPLKPYPNSHFVSHEPDFGYRGGHSATGGSMKPSYVESGRVRISHQTGPPVGYNDGKLRDAPRNRSIPSPRNDRPFPEYNRLSSRPKWVGGNVSVQRDSRRDDSRASGRSNGPPTQMVSGRTRGSYGGYTERQSQNPYGRY